MNKYHKIITLWKREEKKPHNMIIGEYATEELKILKNINWLATEKINGTNIRIMWDGNKIKFGGKTDNSQIQVKLLYKLEKLFSGEIKEQLLEQIFGETNVCFYGEGIGSGVQGDYNNSDFILFDIKIGDFWLQRKDLLEISQKLGIKVVPIVKSGTLEEMSDFCSKKYISFLGDYKAEGIVAKPEIELFNRKGERIITKLKYKDFEKVLKE